MGATDHPSPQNLVLAQPPAALEAAEVAERIQREVQAFLDQFLATTVTVHCTPTGYTIQLAQDGRVAPPILLPFHCLGTMADVRALRRKIIAAALQLVASGRLLDRWA